MLSKWILVGGGVAVVIAAGWGVYAYFDKEGTKMEVTLCVAPDEHWCPKGSVFLTKKRWLNNHLERNKTLSNLLASLALLKYSKEAFIITKVIVVGHRKYIVGDLSYLKIYSRLKA